MVSITVREYIMLQRNLRSIETLLIFNIPYPVIGETKGGFGRPIEFSLRSTKGNLFYSSRLSLTDSPYS